MSNSRRRAAVASAVAAGIALPMIMWSTPAGADPGMENMSADEALATKVDAEVLSDVDTDGEATFWVNLESKADLSAARAATSKADKGTAVFEALTANAKASQAQVIDLLEADGVDYQSYWIVNTIKVTGDSDVLADLAMRVEVDTIIPEKVIQFDEPLETNDNVPQEEVAWGVENINAPQAWDEFGAKGDDIVVANLDTGVDYTHVALVDKYRGNNGDGTFTHDYNFYDPDGLCGSSEPCDTHGHGSHTMGTMVGSEATQTVGVAPNAKWIAAVGCGVLGCPDTALLGGAQFILAPTDVNGENPMPELAPDVVNNSWGSDADDPWFEEVVDAWTAAGIFSSWSNGNNGEAGCESSGSPGIYSQSYSSGAYDVDNEIAYFSSRGPGRDGEVKPNIAAPGVDVISAKPGGGYQGMSGTSMAAPHTAGVVAQMWSAAPSLRGDVAATQEILNTTARDTANDECGGTTENNNVFGEGRLDAYAAVAASPMGETGSLDGTVTSEGTAVEGATVSVTGPLDRQTTTAADGTYQFAVLSTGEYTVTASKFGYLPATDTVTVAQDGAVTADLDLEPAPADSVTGTVTDGSGHGWPLYAEISVVGTDVVTYTDPETGGYALDLPEGDYTLNVAPVYTGYDAVTQDVSTGTAADVAVPVAEDCAAPGYGYDRSQMPLYETFDGTDVPEGWTVTNEADFPWEFTDLGGNGNRTGGDGGFAVADSDATGGGMDTELVSPVFDLSTSPEKVLTFASDYYHLGNSRADVQISADGGATWTEVWNAEASARGPATVSIDLAEYADSTEFQVKFHYADNGSWAWWWQVDNVQIGVPVCAPSEGGLVIGNVIDANTGGAVNDATITDTVSGTTAKSFETPDDPAIADGFFWLYTDALGEHDVTATRSGWSTETSSVDVVADGVARTEFTLGSGHLVLGSDSLSSNVTLGGSWTEEVSLTNTGTAPVGVELGEREGGFTPMGGKSVVDAALSEPASPDMFTGEVTSSNPTADGEWTALPDLPAAAFDTTSAYLDGVSYTIGGVAGVSGTAAVYAFDLEAGEWSQVADLPEALMQARAVSLDGKLYVFGGWSSSSTVATTYIYDPAEDSWSEGASAPAGRAAEGVAVADGGVYLIGGCSNSASCDPTANTWFYDPAADSWTELADYPSLFAHGACGGVNDVVVCAGGTSGADLDTTYVYNAGSDSWEERAALPRPLWGMASAAANGMLVVSNGVVDAGSALTNETLGYDPAADEWVELAPSNSELYRTSMSCGIVKAGGRTISNTASSGAELLEGYTECSSGGADLPWLSTDGTEFTVDPGETIKVEITMSAGDGSGIDQPGVYNGSVVFNNDTPYGKLSLDVTMSVAPAVDMGKATVVVNAYASCEADAAPLAGAQVQFLAADGWLVDLSSDNMGEVSHWLDAAQYTVIVSKDGWSAQVGWLTVEAGRSSSTAFTLDKLGCQAVKVAGGTLPMV